MTLQKTTPLVLAIFTLVGGAIVSALVLTPAAYAQLSDIGDIVGDTLESVGITEPEEEDSNIEQQPIDQESDQVGQEVVNQSEDFDGTSTNTQTQAEVNAQDITQGLADGEDSAESKSESGDAEKYSSSSSSCITHTYGEPIQECEIGSLTVSQGFEISPGNIA